MSLMPSRQLSKKLSNKLSKKSQKVAIPLSIISLIAGTVALSAYAHTPQISHTSQATAQPSAQSPQTIKLERMQGDINKTLEIFSLTTKQSQRYYVYDPDNLLDGIAKQHGITSSYYQLKGVCVTGNLSAKGSYGHLGQFERQLTVKGLC